MPFIRYKKPDSGTPPNAGMASDTPQIMIELMLEHISFNYAPMFLIPGIHGHGAELKELAENLSTLSGGTQRIYIYHDPHINNPKAALYQSASEHAEAIAKSITNLYKKSRTYLPPIIIGFSYGAMLASYVTDQLLKEKPKKAPRLIVIDGGTHSALKAYYQSSDSTHIANSINELHLIINTAARYAKLTPLESISDELKAELENYMRPSRIAASIHQAILNANQSASTEARQLFSTLLTIINQNLDTISEQKAADLHLRQVYTLFTKATQAKLNQQPALDHPSKFTAGFDLISNSLTHLSDENIENLNHLQLITQDGARLVAESIYQALSNDLNSEKHMKSRSDKWLRLSVQAHMNFIKSHSSSSSDEEYDDTPEPQESVKNLTQSSIRKISPKISRKHPPRAERLPEKRYSTSPNTSEFLSAELSGTDMSTDYDSAKSNSSSRSNSEEDEQKKATSIREKSSNQASVSKTPSSLFSLDAKPASSSAIAIPRPKTPSIN